MSTPNAVTRKSGWMLCMLSVGLLMLGVGSAAQAAIVPYISTTSPEVPLLTILGTVTGNASNYHYVGTTISDQIADKVFHVCSPGSAQFTIQVVYTAHQTSERFGYYQPVGTNPIGASPTFSIPGVHFVIGDLDHNPGTPLTMTGTGSMVGPFALFADDETYSGTRPKGYYPSEDQYEPDGLPHMAVFREKDANGNYVPCSILVAVEDLYGGGDKDYNDFVFRIRNVENTIGLPEPATLTLMGAGLALAAIRRRRGRKG